MSFHSVLGIPFWVLLIFLSEISHVRTSDFAYVNGGKKTKHDPLQVKDWSYDSEGDLKWQLTDESIFVLENREIRKGQEVSITSPQISSYKNGGCLTFSMIVGMAASLSVFVSESETSVLDDNNLVWARTENWVNWHKASVDISKEITKNNFFIIIKGKLSTPKKQYIYIKDGVFQEGKCKKEDETFSGIHKCDFEEKGFCNWEKSTKSVQWNLDAGRQHKEYYSFRNYSIPYGHFASIEIPSDKALDDKSRVDLTHNNFKSGKSCMRFFYLLQGSGEPGTLTVNVKKDGSTEDQVFAVSGRQGGQWREAVVNLAVDSKYNIVVGFTPQDPGAIVAIDDIRIKRGKCPALDLVEVEPVKCEFDPKTIGCEYNVDVYYGHKYEIVSDTEIGRGYGLIALDKVDTANLQGPSVASIVSQMYLTTSQRVCIIFDYRVQIDSNDAAKSSQDTTELPNLTAKLSFHTSADYFVSPRWYRIMSTSDGWRTSMFEVDVTQNFRFDFHSSIRPNTTGYVAVGKYEIINSECPTDNNMCTFENGQCGWKSDKETDDQTLWTLTSGQGRLGTGPRGDRSFYAGTGHYMLFNTENLQEGKSGSLTHEFKAKTAAHCLSFWWNMNGNGKKFGRLEIRVQAADSKDPVSLWTRTKPAGGPFVYGQVEVSVEYMKKNFQLSFYAIAGSNQLCDIAIDEVNFEEGPCSKEGDYTEEDKKTS